MTILFPYLDGEGEGGGGGTPINNQNITVTQNGEYQAESGYTGLGTVTVNTPVINNQDITVTQNGEYTAESGYSGLGTVTVNTPVVNNQNITVTDNGEYTAEEGYTGLGTVTVDVPTGGGDLQYAPFTINLGATSGNNNITLSSNSVFYKYNINTNGSSVEPTINRGVISDITADTLIRMSGYLFNVSEFQMCFTTSSDVTTLQGILGSITGPEQWSTDIVIDNGTVNLATGIVDGVPTLTSLGISVVANTKYWLKFEQSMENMELTPYISTDGETFTAGTTITSVPEQYGNYIGMTAVGPSDENRRPFLGTIDLNYWYSTSQYGGNWEGVSAGTPDNYSFADWDYHVRKTTCTVTTDVGVTKELVASALDTTSVVSGAYFVFVNITNNIIWLSTALTVSKDTPTNPSNGDCWYDVSAALAVFKVYDSNLAEWVHDSNSVYVGTCNIVDGGVGSIWNRPFNTILSLPQISLDGKYKIEVIDYDGTILAVNHLNTGDKFTLPDPPQHDKLVFDGWIIPSPYTLDSVTNSIEVGSGDIQIGVAYNTVSGMSEFDIYLGSATTVNFLMGGTKDWGDGTTSTDTSHAYSSSGRYTIKCDGTYFSGNNSYNLFNIGTSSTCSWLTAVRLGKGVSYLKHSLFRNCYNLLYVTAPAKNANGGNITFGYAYSFAGCSSLGGISAPFVNLSEYMFDNCYSLKHVIGSITGYIYGRAFENCYSIESLPDAQKDVSQINSYAFVNCYSLRKVQFNALSTIQSNAFSGNTYVTEYNYEGSTKVPSAVDNSFTLIPSVTKMKVPSNLYDTWRTTRGWSAYAGAIVPV